MPDIYEVSHVIHDVIELTLQPDEKRIIQLGYTPNNFRIYSKSVAFRQGWVSCLPGTTTPENRSLKLLPNMALNVPARGSEISLHNLAALSASPVSVDARAAVNAHGPVGNQSGTVYWRGQGFGMPSQWLLRHLEIRHSSSASPVGTMTWEIRAINGFLVGDVLLSGEYTPTDDAYNVIDVASDVLLPAGKQWLTFRPTQVQPTNSNWLIAMNDPGVLPGYNTIYTTNGWVNTFGASGDLLALIEGEAFGELIPSELVIEVS